MSRQSNSRRGRGLINDLVCAAYSFSPSHTCFNEPHKPYMLNLLQQALGNFPHIISKVEILTWHGTDAEVTTH